MLRSGEYSVVSQNTCAFCGGGVLALLRCEGIISVPVVVPDRTRTDSPNVERCVCAACAEAITDAHLALTEELEDLDIEHEARRLVLLTQGDGAPLPA